MRTFEKSALLIGWLVAAPVQSTFANEHVVNSLDYPGPAWSPYFVGAGIGALVLLTLHFSDKAIGASSFYATVAGFLGRTLARRHTHSLAYFKANPPKIGWEFIFVLATIMGGAIAAATGGEFANQWIPPMWEERFGDSIALRAVVALGGGCVMGFGARLAGGCTSGHGISGTMQLNVGSWISAICFFVGGMAVAIPLFKS